LERGRKVLPLEENALKKKMSPQRREPRHPNEKGGGKLSMPEREKLTAERDITRVRRKEGYPDGKNRSRIGEKGGSFLSFAEKERGGIK